MSWSPVISEPAIEPPQTESRYLGRIDFDENSDAIFHLDVTNSIKHDSWITIKNIFLILDGKNRSLLSFSSKQSNNSHKRWTRITEFTTEILTNFSDHGKLLNFEILYSIPNSNDTFSITTSNTTVNFYAAFGGTIIFIGILHTVPLYTMISICSSKCDTKYHPILF